MYALPVFYMTTNEHNCLKFISRKNEREKNKWKKKNTFTNHMITEYNGCMQSLATRIAFHELVNSFQILINLFIIISKFVLFIFIFFFSFSPRLLVTLGFEISLEKCCGAIDLCFFFCLVRQRHMNIFVSQITIDLHECARHSEIIARITHASPFHLFKKKKENYSWCAVAKVKPK